HAHRGAPNHQVVTTVTDETLEPAATDRSHWQVWHDKYDTDASLQGRLVVVQGRVRDALHAAPPGVIRVLSLCAGDGRDLAGAFAGHPRARDVGVTAVELDEVLAASAAAGLTTVGAHAVDVVNGDASVTSTYAHAVPTDLLLLCGIFGNIATDDVEHT